MTQQATAVQPVDYATWNDAQLAAQRNLILAELRLLDLLKRRCLARCQSLRVMSVEAASKAQRVEFQQQIRAEKEKLKTIVAEINANRGRVYQIETEQHVRIDKREVKGTGKARGTRRSH